MGGFLLGFALIAVFRPVFRDTNYVKKSAGPPGDYIRKSIGFVYFLFWFTIQFLKANAKIAWAVMTRPNKRIQPGIFTFDVTALTTFEVVLVSQCITLTPGTTTVMVSDDQNTIYVHAFDGDEVAQEREYLKKGLIKNILSFTR